MPGSARAAIQPSPTKTAPTSNSGAFIHRRWTPAAATASVHTVIRQTSPNVPGEVSSSTGVAVPAMRKKIIMWSRRCIRARPAWVQRPRWYTALTPNKAVTLVA